MLSLVCFFATITGKPNSLTLSSDFNGSQTCCNGLLIAMTHWNDPGCVPGILNSWTSFRVLDVEDPVWGKDGEHYNCTNEDFNRISTNMKANQESGWWHLLLYSSEYYTLYHLFKFTCHLTVRLELERYICYTLLALPIIYAIPGDMLFDASIPFDSSQSIYFGKLFEAVAILPTEDCTQKPSLDPVQNHVCVLHPCTVRQLPDVNVITRKHVSMLGSGI